MDEGRDDGDRIWDKMYQLQAVVVQQATEEVTGRDVEAALEVGCEYDLFLGVLRW